MVRNDPILDMSTEEGRMLLKSMRDWTTTGFSPWDDKKHGTEAHWRSNKKFMRVPFGSFKLQARKLAEIIRAQAPAHTIPSLKYKATSSLQKKKEQNKSSDNTIMKFSSSIRAPLNITFPGNDRIFLLFELDGETKDDTAHEFEIDGTVLRRWSRVPKERLNALSLISSSSIMISAEFAFMDADVTVIKAVIDDRMGAIKKAENGEYWEVRDEVKLAFPCKPCFYNKKGETMKKFIIERNEKGYAWGYFWLVGKHVGQTYAPPKRMGGMEATQTSLPIPVAAPAPAPTTGGFFTTQTSTTSPPTNFTTQTSPSATSTPAAPTPTTAAYFTAQTTTATPPTNSSATSAPAAPTPTTAAYFTTQTSTTTPPTNFTTQTNPSATSAPAAPPTPTTQGIRPHLQ
jgi:hypothetical protein